MAAGLNPRKDKFCSLPFLKDAVLIPLKPDSVNTRKG